MNEKCEAYLGCLAAAQAGPQILNFGAGSLQRKIKRGSQKTIKIQYFKNNDSLMYNNTKINKEVKNKLVLTNRKASNNISI